MNGLLRKTGKGCNHSVLPDGRFGPAARLAPATEAAGSMNSGLLFARPGNREDLVGSAPSGAAVTVQSRAWALGLLGRIVTQSSGLGNWSGARRQRGGSPGL
jgi:hypothetical protein